MDRRQFKLRRPPLILTLCQVVTSPIEDIEDYIPVIQRSLRKLGYPLSEEGSFEDLIFSGKQGNLRFEAIRRKIWKMGTADKCSSVSVTKDGIVFQTSKYTSFESFAQQVNAVVGAFLGATEAELTLRRGLRYVNRIPVRMESGGEYVVSELLGVSVPEDSSWEPLERSSVQADLTRKDTTLLTKLLQTSRSQVLPPDLNPGDVQIPDLEPSDPGVGVMFLDIDHFSKHQMALKIDDVMSDIAALHADIEAQFKRVVTNEALEAWS